jgi:hypothetical protein
VFYYALHSIIAPLKENYTARGPVLCLARQGIHINRTESQQARSIARRAFISYLFIPYGEEETGGERFSIDMISLTGNTQNQAVCNIID